MISHFEKLREDEVNILLKAPVLITILIAGADDKIDKKELQEAVSITKLKQSKGRNLMLEYYQQISNNFESELNSEIGSLPADALKRNAHIVDELRRLNIILPKLDRKFAIQYYESMKDIAKGVATASGGFFGYMAVGYEESKYVDLNFIRNPARLKKPGETKKTS